MSEPVRLQKLLARAGFGSRRACEAFILEGRVMVDSTVVRTLGSKADPETQVVTFDGQRICGPGKKTSKAVREQAHLVYYALNKPTGVLCTNEDPAGRPLAVQLIPEKRRIYCVGRLDLETEGLLLLTNDGELTNLLTHPRFGVEKTYVAKVEGSVGHGQVAKLEKGVWLSEGRTQGAQVAVRRKGRKASTLELTIREGLNRQVRRMLAAVGLRCRRLRRVRVGPIRLGTMPAAGWRMLSREEVGKLREEAERARKRGDAPKSSRPFPRAEDERFEKARRTSSERMEEMDDAVFELVADGEEQEGDAIAAADGQPNGADAAAHETDDAEETAPEAGDAELEAVASEVAEAGSEEEAEDTPSMETNSHFDDDEDDDVVEFEEEEEEDFVPPPTAHKKSYPQYQGRAQDRERPWQQRDASGGGERRDGGRPWQERPPRDRQRPWQERGPQRGGERAKGGRPWQDRAPRDGERKPWQDRGQQRGSERAKSGLPWQDRPPRDGERKPWQDRGQQRGGERAKGGRPWQDRPPRDGERKPWQDRGQQRGGERAKGGRPWQDRPPRDGERKPWQDRGQQRGGERAKGGRPWQDRPPRDGERKPWQDRGQQRGGERSKGGRPWQDRPPRDGDRKPWQDRGQQRGGERSKGGRPWQDRPPRDGDRKPWQDRGQQRGGERSKGGRPWQDRPPRDGQRKPWEGERENKGRGHAQGRRPSGGRSWQDRGAGERPWKDRDARGNRPSQGKPGKGKARPWNKSGGKPRQSEE